MRASYSEFELIQRCFIDKGLGFEREGVGLGIGDDAALIHPPGGRALAMSLDTLVAGVHFPADAAPAQIANRAFAVNLSDLAAMGAEPFCFTLGLTLPASDAAWASQFAEGLLPLAREFNCPLVGGDTTRGPLAVAIQVQGLVQAERALRRSGARVGDLICVTGTLGDAAAALLLLDAGSHLGEDFCLAETPTDEEEKYLLARYFAPQARLGFATRCAELISACLDISDGLAGDLGHILAASGVGAEIELTQLPLSTTTQRLLRPDLCLRAALGGGDDYELCFTAAASELAELQSRGEALGVRVTAVGTIQSEPGLRYCRGGERVDLVATGYRHF